MAEFKKYRRKQIAELRPVYIEEYGNLKMMKDKGISVTEEDILNGSPKAFDMIARNPKNHKDQWLVAKQYFADNFEGI